MTVLVGFIKRVATTNTITDRRLNIEGGIVSREVQETRLERVQNVNYNQSVYQRADADRRRRLRHRRRREEYDFVFAGVAQPQQVVQNVEKATPILRRPAGRGRARFLGTRGLMGNIFLYSLVAAANATLLAAVTVMLFLPNPKRLLVGYLLGGLLVSLTIGFVIVFAVHHSGATSTARTASARRWTSRSG